MEDSYKILIIEDEMIIGANISQLLENLGYNVMGIIPRVEDVLPKIKDSQPDIILMDINLKGEIDGIELSHLIQKKHKIPIIFLTANSDDAHFNRAKMTNPYGFISKPFKKIDIQRTVELAIKRIEEATSNQSTEKPFILSDCIFVRNNDKMIKIPLDEILYIEADRNYSKINTLKKQYLLVSTLKDFDEKLTSNYFIRLHRSFIVNISQIDEIATSHIVIGKKAIPLSVDMKRELLSHIQKI
jgi:DNA-binding LytR/AlgR family response regulator